MNRRGFLSALGALSAAFALDPERLLWVPGAKTVFLPPAAPIPIKPFGVDVEFTDDDLFMTIEDLRLRYVVPMIAYHAENDPEILKRFFPNAAANLI